MQEKDFIVTTLHLDFQFTNEFVTPFVSALNGLKYEKSNEPALENRSAERKTKQIWPK
jgi:hypothetical protein